MKDYIDHAQVLLLKLWQSKLYEDGNPNDQRQVDKEKKFLVKIYFLYSPRLNCHDLVLFLTGFSAFLLNLFDNFLQLGLIEKVLFASLMIVSSWVLHSMIQNFCIKIVMLHQLSLCLLLSYHRWLLLFTRKPSVTDHSNLIVLEKVV